MVWQVQVSPLKLEIINLINSIISKSGKKSAGFSLIELVITIVLLSFISVVVGQILLESFMLFTTAERVSEADMQTLLALERIVNDVHTIRSAGDISTIAASQLAFTDKNGTVVSYQLSGSTILRNSNVLAGGIQTLNFSYLDGNGSATGIASAVRYIIISITATKSGISSTMSTTAGVRMIP